MHLNFPNKLLNRTTKLEHMNHLLIMENQLIGDRLSGVHEALTMVSD